MADYSTDLLSGLVIPKGSTKFSTGVCAACKFSSSTDLVVAHVPTYTAVGTKFSIYLLVCMYYSTLQL